MAEKGKENSICGCGDPSCPGCDVVTAKNLCDCGDPDCPGCDAAVGGEPYGFGLVELCDLDMAKRDFLEAMGELPGIEELFDDVAEKLAPYDDSTVDPEVLAAKIWAAIDRYMDPGQESLEPETLEPETLEPESLDKQSVCNERLETILFAMIFASVSFQVRPRDNMPTSDDVTA